jgi:hypothetical protein
LLLFAGLLVIFQDFMRTHARRLDAPRGTNGRAAHAPEQSSPFWSSRSAAERSAVTVEPFSQEPATRPSPA